MMVVFTFAIHAFRGSYFAIATLAGNVWSEFPPTGGGLVAARAHSVSRRPAGNGPTRHTTAAARAPD